MTRRKPRPYVAPLNVLGTENHPDLSMFETNLKSRLRCTVCGRTGEPEQVWVFVCLAGHPAVCSVADCDKAFTSTGLLARHTASKHPESFPWREDETKTQRIARLKQERRVMLREAGIGRKAAA
jgi:hypothetical protein